MTVPIQPIATAQAGWLCPVCQRGVAPYMPFCPCKVQPVPPIGHGSNTAASERREEGNV